MAEHNSPPDDDSLRAPEPLKRALAELRKERLFVSPAVDEAVLSAARSHLRKRAASRPSWQKWAAMAASLALVAWLALTLLNRPQDGSLAREDINRDGRVDILDAFALARKIERGEPGLRDVNGDGVVDGRDTDEIARHAVKLERKGRS